MLNLAALDAVNNSRFSQGFVKPLYGSYCFSNVPRTIEHLFTGEGQLALPGDVFGDLPTRYEKVILFFVDGFGWRFLERYGEKYQLLKIMLKDGVVSKLTAQFPSTTAAHVTCIHTGLDVGQSGVYEWNYYEPMVDEVITPLLFSYAGDKARDTLKLAGIPAQAYYPTQNFYRTLQARGIVSYVFQNAAFTPSTYSDILYANTIVVPYKRLSEALTYLAHLIERAGKAYYFLYIDSIDAVCHPHGPNSKQSEQEVDRFFTMAEQLFYNTLHGKARNTLLMMIADHGQVEVDPKTTLYLNRDAAGIERYLQVNFRGRPLVPAGSPRDMFLHIKEQYLDEAVAFLRRHLEEKAEVYLTRELLAQGFFGLEEPSAAFLARVGNVVILPYQFETVWWYEAGKFEMHFLGHHGGLTPEEMEIPLMVLPL